MSKIAVVATSNHPLYDKLLKLPHFFIFSPLLDLSAYDYIFDFSINKEKGQLLEKYPAKVFSDLTLDKKTLKSRGVFSTVFPSPNAKFEWYGKDEDALIVKNFFSQLNLTPVKISNANFIFPRVLVQIINEAYFAMEEKVASAKDIDTAMLYGVNYPKGPVAWGKEAGLHHVVKLLDLLYEESQNPRYKVCELLRNGNH